MSFFSPKSWFPYSSLTRFSNEVHYWKVTGWWISCTWMLVHYIPRILSHGVLWKQTMGHAYLIFVLEMMSKVSDRIVGVIEIARLYQRTLSILWFPWNIWEIGDVIRIPFKRRSSKVTSCLFQKHPGWNITIHLDLVHLWVWNKRLKTAAVLNLCNHCNRSETSLWEWLEDRHVWVLHYWYVSVLFIDIPP